MRFLTKIKLSRITNLSDARYAAAAGFEAISFCFDQTDPRFISPVVAKQIIEWTSGIECIGEFHGDKPDIINEVVQLIGLHKVQLRGDYTTEEINSIQVPVILEMDETPVAVLPERVEAVQVVVHTSEAWKYMVAGQTSVSLILAPTFEAPALIKQLLEEAPPYSLSLTAGDEDQTGMRDFEDLDKLLELLLTED